MGLNSGVRVQGLRGHNVNKQMKRVSKSYQHWKGDVGSTPLIVDLALLASIISLIKADHTLRIFAILEVLVPSNAQVFDVEDH